MVVLRMNEKNISKIFALAVLFLSIASAFTIVFSTDVVETQNNDDMEEYYTSALGASIAIKAKKDMFTNVQSSESVKYYRVLNEDSDLDVEADFMDPQNNIPSEKEAVVIADSYVESHGGLPKDAFVKYVEQQYMEKRNQKTGELVEKYPLVTEVNYARIVDGMEVVGPGDFIMVSIGEDGNVLCYMRTWRALQEAGEIDIIPSEQAIAKLESGQIMQKPVSPYQSPLTIDDISLGYYSEAIGEYQEFYMPVWVFSGTDTHGRSVNVVVDALAR